LSDELPDDLLPAAAAARLVPSCRPGKKMHLSTVHRWVAAGKLRGWKVGRWLHVSRAELLALVRPVGKALAERRRREDREEAARADEWARRVLEEAGIT
jgi:excisionase family DNA binding protein